MSSLWQAPPQMLQLLVLLLLNPTQQMLLLLTLQLLAELLAPLPVSRDSTLHQHWTQQCLLQSTACSKETGVLQMQHPRQPPQHQTHPSPPLSQYQLLMMMTMASLPLPVTAQ